MRIHEWVDPILGQAQPEQEGKRLLLGDSLAERERVSQDQDATRTFSGFGITGSGSLIPSSLSRMPCPDPDPDPERAAVLENAAEREDENAALLEGLTRDGD